MSNQYQFHITRVSGNKKVGPIPVTTTSKDSCPDSCPLKAKGCYANGGPLAIHWNKVTNGERGVNASEFLQTIKALPKGQLFRHNQAGDLPHDQATGEIDSEFLTALCNAAKRKRGFTYTHHDWRLNASHLKDAARKGFTVNVSANTVSEATEAHKAGLPTVTLLPMDAPNSQRVNGVQVVACPAEKSDKINCANCALCADADRDYVIGFRAHGVSKKATDIIARG